MLASNIAKNLFACLVLASTLRGSSAQCGPPNPNYNPHSPETSGPLPWFEGWYTRVTGQQGSVAVGIGHFPGQQYGDKPSAACFVLWSTPDGRTQHLMHAFDSLEIAGNVQQQQSARPTISQTISQLRRTVRGKPSALHSVNASHSGEQPQDHSRTNSDSESQATSTTRNLSSPANSSVDFSVQASAPASGETSGAMCRWQVRPGHATVVVKLPDVQVSISTTAGCVDAVTWGVHGSEPEGWAARVPFLPRLMRLHWDALTLATPVMYTLRTRTPSTAHTQAQSASPAVSGGVADSASTELTADGPDGAGSVRAQSAGRRAGAGPEWQLPVKGLGLMHMEKNWGVSFPDKWVWAQAHRINNQGTPQAMFVLAGGMLPHALEPRIPPIQQFVFSYHSPNGSTFTIDPYNPSLLSRLTAQGCSGRLYVQIYALMHVVHVEVQAPLESFTEVTCPTMQGFQDFSVESFNASVHLTVYKRPYPFAPLDSSTLIIEDRFQAAALEFGGAYVCKDKKMIDMARRVQQQLDRAAASAPEKLLAAEAAAGTKTTQRVAAQAERGSKGQILLGNQSQRL